MYNYILVNIHFYYILTLLRNIYYFILVCKKSLNDFLDAKRRIFPRFYFTSEADLLDILSNGSNPPR